MRLFPHVLPVQSESANHCFVPALFDWLIRYLNRRILAATVRDGNMVLLVCVCSEKYWADTEKDLKDVAASFRLA